MTSEPALEVRPLQESDRDAWAALWLAYLDFYKTSLPAATFNVYFDRLLGADPQDFNGLVAVLDGKLVGLTHYLSTVMAGKSKTFVIFKIYMLIHLCAAWELDVHLLKAFTPPLTQMGHHQFIG